MGAGDSKSAHNGDRPEEDENHTPVTNRRVLKLADPRSPTDGIERTPVLHQTVGEAKAFEDPRSPTTKIARTPIPDETDPRSPSVGIERTPGPFVFPTSADPRSPCRDIARTPLSKDAPKESSIDAVDVPQAADEPSSNSTNNNNAHEVNVTAEISHPPIEKVEPSTEQSSSDFHVENDNVNLIEQSNADDNHDCEGQSGLSQINTPEYEMELTKMVEKQTISNEDTDDKDRATLVLSDRDPAIMNLSSSSLSSSCSKKPGLRRSLQDKFQQSLSNPPHPRSPLSTRNLVQDSPDRSSRAAALRATKTGVVYQKTSLRRRLMEGQESPGRYQPVLDKENF